MKQVSRWLGVLWVAACGQPDAQSSNPDPKGKPEVAAPAATREYVDSAIPIEEALRRFRASLKEPVGLSGGFDSRDKLVRHLVQALEARDSAALGPMSLSMAEFAWLYYPSSPMSRPPYELPPGLMWFQLQGESEKGASRLLQGRAGRSLGYVGHSCGEPRLEGENRLHPNCEVRRVTAAGDTVTERLFGLIIQRGRSYKFIGYANKL